MALGEAGERRARAGIEHAATGDDERRLGAAQRGDGGREFVLGRARPAQTPHPLLEEGFRIIERLGLHVLAEREGDRSALGRSVSTLMVRASAGMICSGRVMRSK